MFNIKPVYYTVSVHVALRVEGIDLREKFYITEIDDIVSVYVTDGPFLIRHVLLVVKLV